MISRRFHLALLVSLASCVVHADEPATRALLALPAKEVIRPVMECGEAVKLRSESSEAPYRVLSAAIEPATAERAEFCLVKGYAPRQVQFELRLPTRTYTGRYLQGGCGGICGVIFNRISPSCSNRHALGGAFAVSFNNGGHASASIGDALWAIDAPELREDFAHRASHAAAAAAKAIIRAYYGQPPQHSYFAGCSNGGREALMETQRYPEDFDGVVAGASVSMPAAMQKFIWEAQVGLDAQGQEIITPEAARWLHEAVLAACDKLDGVKDGQIDDPRACRFDPNTLVCRNQASSRCLTPVQAEVARKYYSGPLDANGIHLFPGGHAYGSELTWAGPGANTRGGKDGAEAFLKYLLFPNELAPTFSWRDWTFDKAHTERLLEHGRLYDAVDPDLSAFARHGGKLIVWQGANDPSAGIYGMYDYYQAVRNASAGMENARRFARFFIIPGVYHCGNGYVPYEFDLLGAVVHWVEQGTAPDSVLAVAKLADGKLRERPVFAHPMRAKYTGGDVNSAASFRGEMPKREPDDAYDWVGSIAAKTLRGAK